MKVKCVKVVVLDVILLVMLVVSVNGGVLNEYYCQALPVSCETPKVILEQGIAGTSTIYTNKTSAKVSVAAPTNWWNLDYDYFRQITIVNNVASTLGSGYSVCLTVNTTSLVSGGKMLSSGNDLRIVYWNRSSWVEIDRDVIGMNTGSTQIWFKTQVDISASGSDNNYYTYYGNPSAVNPPANKSNVYDFWDDFDDASLDPAWNFSQIGGASGSYSESATVVILNATTSGDLWGTSDNFLFLSISRSYDVLVESYTSGWGGSHHTWSKMGGIQLRQSVDANSKNRIMSPVYSAVGATNSYRLSTGGSTSETTTGTQPKYCRLSRIGGTSRAWYSTDGVSWTELGSQISFSGGLSDPVRLGIHLAGISSSSHWVEVDWFKVRKYVDPEPSTSVGSEESYSYFPTGYNMLSWWDPHYSYRKQISITNNAASTLDSGYPVCVTIDTSTLVSAGKMIASGDDLRIVWWNSISQSHVELDRINETNFNTTSTQVWFKTQVNIPAISSDNNYYLYYGNPSVITPPAYWSDSMGADSPSRVFWYADSFEEHANNTDSNGWTDEGSEDYKVVVYEGNKWLKRVVRVDWKDGSVATSMSNIGDAVWMVDIRYNQSGSNVWGGIAFHYANDGVGYHFLIRDQGWYWANEDWTVTDGWNSNTDIHFTLGQTGTIKVITVGTTAYCYWKNPDGESPSEVLVTTKTIASGTGKAKIIVESPSVGNNRWIDADNFIVRKYVEPEPSTSLGSETNPKHEVSTEFVFSGMTTNSPTQLNFTVVSHYNISNVNVTIQVWNYSSSAYVTSGEGYLTYTSTGANITKVLNITTNPQFYTSGGYAKIKVTGVNSTTTEFQQKINQIKLTYEYNASSTYDYVLKVVNQVTDNWTVNLQVYDNSSIGRLSSLNISLHDGTSSNQIAVSGGSIVNCEGESYNLPGGAGSTIHISITNLQASTSGTSYMHVYLKILVPDTSTYSLYIITFEIT